MSKASKTSDRNASVSLASDKELLKALPVKTHKTLTERLNGPGLKHFAVHWSLILVFGLLIYLKITFEFAKSYTINSLLKKHGKSCLKKVKTSGLGHQQNVNCQIMYALVF